jgi:two-component system NtrC family response regulator
MATRFLVEVSQQLRRRKTGFTHEAIQAIQDYPWPGNVREVANKIRRAVVMAEGLYITPQDLDLPFEPTVQMKPWAPSLKSARQRAEGDLLAVAMAQNHGNLSRMAQELKISRPTLYRLLSKYNLLTKSSSCDSSSPKPQGWAK